MTRAVSGRLVGTIVPAIGVAKEIDGLPLPTTVGLGIANESLMAGRLMLAADALCLN